VGLHFSRSLFVCSHPHHFRKKQPTTGPPFPYYDPPIPPFPLVLAKNFSPGCAWRGLWVLFPSFFFPFVVVLIVVHDYDFPFLPSFFYARKPLLYFVGHTGGPLRFFMRFQGSRVGLFFLQSSFKSELPGLTFLDVSELWMVLL